MAFHLSFLPLFLPLGLQHRTPALFHKGILGLESPCFVHEGCWGPSYSAMLEDPGQPEAPGPVPAIPAFPRGPCLRVTLEHEREPAVGPTHQSQREVARDCLLPLAPVEPLSAELLTVCSRLEVGAGGMQEPGPLEGGLHPAGTELSGSGASQRSSTWGCHRGLWDVFRSIS